MIKENQQLLNRVHVLIDAIVIYLSFNLAYYFRFICPLTSQFFPDAGYARPFMYYQPRLLFIVPFFLILYAIFHLYEPKRHRNESNEIFDVIKATGIGVIIIIAIIFFGKINHIPRTLMPMFYFICSFNIILERYIIRKVLYRTRKSGRNLKHIILVGYSNSAAVYIDRIKANPQWGYVIHGLFDDRLPTDFNYRGVYVIGKIKELSDFLHNNSLDEVAITLNIREYEKLESIVKVCEKSGVHTKFVPDYYNFISTRPYTEDLDGLPIINIRNVPLTNTGNRIVKRFIDIVGSLAAILIFSPVMIVVAILVKFSSPGPIIFTQERIGLHNKAFNMYKFRSMGVQPKSKEKSQWTTSNDPRVTKVGKFIRRTSIDELPQLFNVLKGDMSLVGPRPERPFFVEKFQEEIPRYMIKHQVRPGMTGWAQINGFRGNTSIRGRIEHDLYYIENWSLALDFKILFLTIFKGFVNENAY